MGLYNDGIPDDGYLTEPRSVEVLPMLDALIEHLREHGCHVLKRKGGDLLLYPAGSHFERRVPYSRANPHYFITLPNGAHVDEHMSSTSGNIEISVPEAEVTPERLKRLNQGQT